MTRYVCADCLGTGELPTAITTAVIFCHCETGARRYHQYQMINTKNDIQEATHENTD